MTESPATHEWLAPRKTLYGTKHAVSSGHYLASAAAFAILEAGGNAVDAGCCAGMALAILHADEVNFAGVAPIMIRLADGTTVSLDGLGVWPASIPADLFMTDYDGTIPTGILRTVVPAAPDAWITALRDYGTLSFAQVAEASIRLARDGFAAFELLVEGISKRHRGYRKWPANEAIYLPGGEAPAIGDRFVQTDLARSIQLMADAETAVLAEAHADGDVDARLAGLEAARAVFYDGELSEMIVNYHEQNGGYLSRDDLKSFRSRYEKVYSTTWRDLELLTCGPWCQGPSLAQALLILEEVGLDGLEHNSPEYIHTVVEALKGVFSDREHLYGDPAFVDVDIDRLLSTEHAAARAAQIDPARANPGLPDLIFGTPQPLPEPQSYDEIPIVGEGGTSYVCVVDQWGNAFSATPSDGASTSPVIPGTGFVPSLRGLQSRPDPKHPSGVAPGKRPRLTPNPAIVVTADGSVMPFGCPGGDMQVQAMLQVFLNYFHFGMELQEAVNAPRFSTWSFPNSFAPFDYLPSRLILEDRFADETIASLQAKGHDVRRWPAYTREAAAVEAILKNAATGFLEAAADPRQPATAYVA
ncbi:gamma-glutamyltransferase family protein [Subtercola endophyticus]|uniref:gamma-glutamyltransferase family protein n=1 Tax=Subtercola endophyticus TaxID=2895559 RepID=UPI001E340DC9|nr:gamma-glutamyltransferase [Subtercola endophyticus]UFS58675.1 gamma-glutamyltransferase [Subtercola endophyticus]